MRYVDIVVYAKDVDEEKYHSILPLSAVQGVTKTTGEGTVIRINNILYTLITRMTRVHQILNGEANETIQAREIW